MSRNIKHVGQLVNTQKKVVVVFRELPDDPNHCLVVDTDALPDWMHDNVITAVESPGAQASANFFEYAERTVFTDGTNMLQTLHNTNRLQHVATANVIMTPNNTIQLPLDELNNIIREQTDGAPIVSPPEDQLGMAGKEELTESVAPEAPSMTNPDPGPVEIDDVDMAQTLIAQADQFAAEADRLRQQAYELNPDLKPKRGRKSKAQLEAEAAAAAAVANAAA